MKILCAYSGIEFSCDHFPLGLYARESYHPIFNVPQRKLLSCIPKWAGGELTDTDSYLLFLALLNSSERIEFRTSARITRNTRAIVAQNMEHLAKVICQMNTVVTPAVVFPSIAITQETATLENAIHWIERWKEGYQDFLDGYKSAHDLSKINRREAALERMIKNPYKKREEWVSSLAEWAAAAGDFPVFKVTSPLSKLETPLAEYWKTIIVRCASELYLYSIPRKDIQELMDHCEEHINFGTIFSKALFTVLRNALEKQKNFLDLGDIDLSTRGKTIFSIIGEETSTEQANMQALIASAPEKEPKREDYPSKFEFMRAKMRWTMAQKQGNGQ